MVQSLTLRGVDLTDEPLDVKNDVSGLVFTLTSRLTDLNGRVTDEKGTPVSNYAVIVFPDDSARWGFGSRFVSVGQPGQDGRYRITKLPAGFEYLAVAIDYLEEGREQDPDFLSSLRATAKRISISEGQAQTVDLRLIRIRIKSPPPTVTPPAAQSTGQPSPRARRERGWPATPWRRAIQSHRPVKGSAGVTSKSSLQCPRERERASKANRETDADEHGRVADDCSDQRGR